MVPPTSSPFLRAALALALLVLALGKPSLQAQEQESGLLSRILHPDTGLAYVPAEKKFGSTARFGGKTASTKTFAFSRPAGLAGDGKFQTRDFATRSFGTQAYGETDKTLSTRGFSQTNKLFDTRDFSVREARDANKALPIRTFGRADQTFVPHGKRQDTYDYMLSQKNLTIDQVRELLNKNK